MSIESKALSAALKFLTDTVTSDTNTTGYRMEAAREILKYSLVADTVPEEEEEDEEPDTVPGGLEDSDSYRYEMFDDVSGWVFGSGTSWSGVQALADYLNKYPDTASQHSPHYSVRKVKASRTEEKTYDLFVIRSDRVVLTSTDRKFLRKSAETLNAYNTGAIKAYDVGPSMQ